MAKYVIFILLYIALITGVSNATNPNPSVLLLDEPFSAVDQVTRRKLQQELVLLRRNISVPILLVNPVTRKNEGVLTVACLAVFFGTWIDKGLGMISGGFVPSPLHKVNEYIPTIPEIVITLGVWALGFFVLTVLFKIAVGVKEEVRA